VSWFKVDDGMPFHPKFIQCSTQAIGAWALMGAWSSWQLTDGFIPAAMLPALRVTDADAEELVAAGLLAKAKGGFRMHDFTDYNPTARQVRSDRAKSAERLRKWRAKKAAEGGGGSETEM